MFNPLQTQHRRDEVILLQRLGDISSEGTIFPM